MLTFPVFSSLPVHQIFDSIRVLSTDEDQISQIPDLPSTKYPLTPLFVTKL